MGHCLVIKEVEAYLMYTCSHVMMKISLILRAYIIYKMYSYRPWRRWKHSCGVWRLGLIARVAHITLSSSVNARTRHVFNLQQTPIWYMQKRRRLRHTRSALIHVVQGEGNTYCALTAGEFVQNETFSHISGCGDPLGAGHKRAAHIPIQKAFIPPIETYSHTFTSTTGTSVSALTFCVCDTQSAAHTKETHTFTSKRPTFL